MGLTRRGRGKRGGEAGRETSCCPLSPCLRCVMKLLADSPKIICVEVFQFDPLAVLLRSPPFLQSKLSNLLNPLSGWLPLSNWPQRLLKALISNISKPPNSCAMIESSWISRRVRFCILIPDAGILLLRFQRLTSPCLADLLVTVTCHVPAWGAPSRSYSFSKTGLTSVSNHRSSTTVPWRFWVITWRKRSTPAVNFLSQAL